MHCTICSVELKNPTALRNHLRDNHPQTAAFECDRCNKRFKHKVSLTRHTSTCGQLVKRRKIENDMLSKTVLVDDHSKHQRFFTLNDYRTSIANIPDFEVWAKHYQNLRCRDDFPLSDGTVVNIIQTNTLCQGINWSATHDNLCDELDTLFDAWYAQDGLQKISVVNRMRHVIWLLRWRAGQDGNNGIDDALMMWLQDTVESGQANATKSTVDTTCIALLDPYQLAVIHDYVVDALRKQQHNRIYPFMSKFFKYPQAIPKVELIQFGLELRCWLDLAMRFAGVPMRIQCTVSMVEPNVNATQYVCKLTQRDHEYWRIVYQDKSGGSHQPIEIALGPTISQILAFYRINCRADNNAIWTFQTRTGSQWVRASADIKQYMVEHLAIDPDKIESNGRFVHGSRHIGLATFALSVDFDTEALRNLALLMRHNTVTAEKYYSIWQTRVRNQRAMQQFTQCIINGENSEEKTPTHPVPRYQPLTVLPLPTYLTDCIHLTMKMGMSQLLSCPVTYFTRDMGTQTGDCMGETDIQLVSVQELTSSTSLPICTQCRQTCVVFGPLGLSRHRMYGRYYAQCRACHGSRPTPQKTHQTYWYALGCKPPIASCSTCPRNMAAIDQFIKQQHSQ